MCGIAGFLNQSVDGQADDLLSDMLGLIRHRGPDGEGRLHLPECGLHAGMRRLAIIDLETGDQPVWNEDHSVAVLFNGEIYNYRELRSQLLQQGHQLTTAGDTEVLVHLYEEHGTEMFRHLRGMYSFALVDQRRRRLILARDPFGQKHLYWSCDPTAGNFRIAFASELKALLALPWIDRSPRAEATLEYLAFLSLPAPWTHFRAIQKLPPGSWIEVDLNPRGDPHRRVSGPHRHSAHPPPSTDPYARAGSASAKDLGAALEGSVGLHLRADVPVGVFLSSGLDSTMVAAAIRRAGVDGASMHSFTVVTGQHDPVSGNRADETDDESVGAAATAAWLGCRHHEVHVGASDLAASIEDVAWHLDEPVGDPAAFALLHLSRRAAADVKVVLSGEGSDELLAGYAGRYAGMLHTLRRTAWLKRWSGFLPAGDITRQASRWERLLLRLSRSERAAILAIPSIGFPIVPLPTSPFAHAQLQRVASRLEQWSEEIHWPPDGTLLETCQAADLAWQLPEFLLQKADKMSMAASLELRCPFLDRDVAAVAAALPGPAKLDEGRVIGKLALREVLRQWQADPGQDRSQLDPDILDHLDPNRPKRGFPLPLGRWLRGPLREQVEAEIFAANAHWQNACEPAPMRATWQSFLAGAPGLAQPFYALWLMEVWHRKIRSGATLGE